jgi:hypothetical protein
MEAKVVRISLKSERADFRGFGWRGLTARLKTLDIAVSPRTARRRGVTKENTPRESLTEEQRSRRAVFGETLRAEALLARFFVAPRFQTLRICALVAPRTGPKFLSATMSIVFKRAVNDNLTAL